MAEENKNVQGRTTITTQSDATQPIIRLTPKDFELVGQVAAHCDPVKLNVAVREAVLFDMEDIFCDFWHEIESNWQSTENHWDRLINGGTYGTCSGASARHGGIKTALIYYAYARYLIINGFNDTPTGHVQKTNDFSIPKPLKEIQQFSDKYRNMGRRTLEGITNFLCLERDFYKGWNSNGCAPCGCSGICGSKTNTKGHGIRSKTISRWDVGN